MVLSLLSFDENLILIDSNCNDLVLIDSNEFLYAQANQKLEEESLQHTFSEVDYVMPSCCRVTVSMPLWLT